MKKKLLLFIVLPSYSLIAQVGIGTITPHPDAVLDVTSTTSGLLLPRLSLAATTLATPMAAHVAGMIVYNMSAVGSGSTAVYPGVSIKTGTSWIRYQEANIGDVASGRFRHSIM